MEVIAKNRTSATYDSYKDSGVEWLGDIPEHWEYLRMKRLFKDFSLKNRPNAELLSVTQDKGVVPRSWVENRMVMPSGALESFKYIEKGDFAISLRSFEGGLEYCHHDGIISPAYTVLKKNRHDLVDNFYKYLFKSHSFISELQTSVVGIREGKNISYPELSYSFLPIPSVVEQTAIAKFLDEKTEKIDRAIAQKERLIELLKERKQILIQNAVTKGLNPNVKLKDSDVEWIGEIPEHWEVKRLKRLGKIISGYAFPSDSFKTSGTRVLKIANIQTMRIDWTDESYVDDKLYDALPQFQINEGDLIFALTRPIISTGIKATIVPPTNEKLLLNQRNSVLKPFIKSQKSWLYYVILDSGFRQEFNNQIDFTGQQPNISPIDIGNLKIPLPALSELKEIVLHVEKGIGKIDETILIQLNQIEKLKEYKSTLIDSAVTGKIKVCWDE